MVRDGGVVLAIRMPRVTRQEILPRVLHHASADRVACTGAGTRQEILVGVDQACSGAPFPQGEVPVRWDVALIEGTSRRPSACSTVARLVGWCGVMSPWT